MTPKNYQDLEDRIYDVWAVKDIVDTVIWRYVDHPKPMTEDQMWNHLESISVLLNLHCEKLMDTYCKVFELNEYASDEVKERRAQMLKEFAEHIKPKKAKKK